MFFEFEIADVDCIWYVGYGYSYVRSYDAWNRNRTEIEIEVKNLILLFESSSLRVNVV